MAEQCSCCQNNSKYEIAGDKYCGKHIGYGLDMHLAIGVDAKVCKVKEQE